MNLHPNNPAADFVARIRREETRSAQQRSASAHRRGQRLEQLSEVLGSQAAAAAELGTSPAAVSKAINATKARPPRTETIIDYLELSLPSLGERVPTADEWATVPGEDREAIAAEAMGAWQGLATVLGVLTREMDAAARYLARSARGVLDDDEEEPVLVAATRRRIPGQDTHWEMSAWGDISRGLRERLTEAHRQVEIWEQRAGVSHSGGVE